MSRYDRMSPEAKSVLWVVLILIALAAAWFLASWYVIPANAQEAAPVAIVQQTWWQSIWANIQPVLTAVATSAAPVIAAFIINWLVKLAAKLKVDVKDADRARLQQMIENGIKWAAQKFEITLNGSVAPRDKEALIAEVVAAYLPKNAAETVRALGGDVTDIRAMTEIVTARAADILALPAEIRAMKAAPPVIPAG